jgi:hypothetical protein
MRPPCEDRKPRLDLPTRRYADLVDPASGVEAMVAMRDNLKRLARRLATLLPAR